MNHYVKTLAPSQSITPQSEPIPGRETEMVKNSADGFTFTLDMWGYLDRFLILGSDTPSYYASAQKLTRAAAKNVEDCIKADGVRAVTASSRLAKRVERQRMTQLFLRLRSAQSWVTRKR